MNSHIIREIFGFDEVVSHFKWMARVGGREEDVMVNKKL